jgi:hypothetical protein
MNGVTPADFVVICVELLTCCAALLASVFVAGQAVPDSWSGCRQESVAMLAAACWTLFQWFVFGALYGLGL